jgi:thiamine kinase-like enzyme
MDNDCLKFLKSIVLNKKMIRIKKILNILTKILNFITSKKTKIQKNLLLKMGVEKYISIKTHKNNTSLIYFPNKNFYRKFSTKEGGIKKIVSEKNGIKWYLKKLSFKENYFIIKYFNDKKIAFLDTKAINGKKIKSWEPLEINFPYIIKAYKHYILNFKNEKKTQIHGDLTLDNMIFKKNGVFFLDWEFFQSKKYFFGYDLAYLFLSSVCLPVAAGKNISEKDKFLFSKLWKILKNMKIHNKITQNPFQFFETIIKTDRVLKKSYRLSKTKFFPFTISSKKKKEIIKMIEKVE